MLSEETRERILGYLPRYRTKRAAILPALWAAQDEVGWLNTEAYEEVGELLDMHPTDVAAIASFYYMFHKQPMGQYVIEVCNNLSCELQGASEMLEHLRQELGIQDGQTTADRAVHPAPSGVPLLLRVRARYAGQHGDLRQPDPGAD